jgi:hypothetical protein
MKSQPLPPLTRAFAMLSALILSLSTSFAAVGDGPRSYIMTPEGSQLVSLYGLFIDGNQALNPGVTSNNLDIEVDVGVLQFTQAFSLWGNACGAFLIAPMGSTEGTFNFNKFSISGKSSGLADIQLGGIFGIYGAPALPVADYVKYDPGLSAGILTKITAPTGEYDANQAINLGANRWALQLGAPVAYYLGDSFLDPQLTTFEFLPSVFIFGNNSDPFLADDSEQDPLFQIEAHITRNLNKMFWVSLDATFEAGGETSTDGVSADDQREAFALGGSVGINFSKTFSANASYGKVVSRNDDGPEGNLFRIKLGLIF